VKILGVDLSTNYCGLFVIEDSINNFTAELINISKIPFFDRSNKIFNSFIKNFDKHDLIIVREENLLNFKYGRSNKKGLINLIKIGTLFDYNCYKQNYNLYTYNVLHARKIAGFKRIKGIDTKSQIDIFIKNNYINIYDYIHHRFNKKFDDINDAFILALAYFNDNRSKF